MREAVGKLSHLNVPAVHGVGLKTRTPRGSGFSHGRVGSSSPIPRRPSPRTTARRAGLQLVDRAYRLLHLDLHQNAPFAVRGVVRDALLELQLLGDEAPADQVFVGVRGDREGHAALVVVAVPEPYVVVLGAV